MPLPFTACTVCLRRNPRDRGGIPQDRGGGSARMLGRYSGAIRGGGNRQETGHGLPGAAGELKGAE